MGCRKVERLSCDIWLSIEFEDLKKGDIFRLFEDDEKTELVKGKEGHVNFIVLSLPVPCLPLGNFKIDADPIDEIK